MLSFFVDSVMSEQQFCVEHSVFPSIFNKSNYSMRIFRTCVYNSNVFFFFFFSFLFFSFFSTFIILLWEQLHPHKMTHNCIMKTEEKRRRIVSEMVKLLQLLHLFISQPDEGIQKTKCILKIQWNANVFFYWTHTPLASTTSKKKEKRNENHKIELLLSLRNPLKLFSECYKLNGVLCNFKMYLSVRTLSVENERIDKASRMTVFLTLIVSISINKHWRGTWYFNKTYRSTW